MRKLTIGMATFDDFDGLYFTIQAIRTYHREVINDIEFVIIDNNHGSEDGRTVRSFINRIKEPVQYLPFTKYQATIVKNKVFDLADTPYVLCIDSHVLLEPGSLKKLIDYYESGKDDGNLLQGPLLYDKMDAVSTHFNLDKWGSHMWGAWDTDPRGLNPNGEPFEIPAQGMGLFSCRKDAWLGFNREFRGFGGEEGYIHEKYRKNGKKVMCLPFLRWVHRFDRPKGISYPNNLKDRFRNYYLGFSELELDKTELLEQFKNIATPQYIKQLDQEFAQMFPNLTSQETS